MQKVYLYLCYHLIIHVGTDSTAIEYNENITDLY